MDVLHFQNKIEKIEEQFSEEKKKYIHFYSFKNFVTYLPQIKRNRSAVISNLEKYFEEVESVYHEPAKKVSYNLAVKYLDPISSIYKKQLGFMRRISLISAIFFGISGDLLLLSIGL